MPAPANAILYISRIIIARYEPNPEKQAAEAEEYLKKYDSAINQISYYSWISKIFFLAGIIIFLIYAGNNLKG